MVHETGHQFWYGMVGSNEFEHAWMDEGIDTFSAARALAEDFPERDGQMGSWRSGRAPSTCCSACSAARASSGRHGPAEAGHYASVSYWSSASHCAASSSVINWISSRRMNRCSARAVAARCTRAT